jgi:hypothetical protein
MTPRRLARCSFALAVGAALLAPSASLGDGVVEPTPPPVSAAPPPAPRGFGPAECVGNAPIGQVVSVSGSAHAHAPGQAPRSLACDDALRACEELVTEPGGSLGFLSGDVLVRVGPGSRVALAGSEGVPDLFVHNGAVRSTDGRRAGAPPVRLTARDLAARASAADAELTSGTGGASRLCAYEGRATVEAGAASHDVGAGRCFAAEAGAPARFAAAGAPALGLEAPGFCSYEVAIGDELSPTDVAAPGFAMFPGMDPGRDILRDPCDEPGAGCNTFFSDGGIGFDDPDPEPGCGAPGVSC